MFTWNPKEYSSLGVGILYSRALFVKWSILPDLIHSDKKGEQMSGKHQSGQRLMADERLEIYPEVQGVNHYPRSGTCLKKHVGIFRSWPVDSWRPGYWGTGPKYWNNFPRHEKWQLKGNGMKGVCMRVCRAMLLPPEQLLTSNSYFLYMRSGGGGGGKRPIS